ncbi:MAG TPA: hypothetical protein VG757_00390 [Devosia sp.]|nr:hypothetical protein [Devosia sp.]
MDRLISLLAALVGLIALAAAVLVEVHGQTERKAIATELAAIRSSIEALQKAPAPAVQAPQPDNSGTVEALLALQQRIKTLEDQAATQQTSAATEASKVEPLGTGAASAITADGPTTNCIPIGTRFMAAAGDDTAICRTDVVIRISEVGDGTAIVEGAGPIAAGGFGKLGFGGCTVMVFSSDTASGYAELRVSCQ